MKLSFCSKTSDEFDVSFQNDIMQAQMHFRFLFPRSVSNGFPHSSPAEEKSSQAAKRDI
jgi:hypothetical protein